MSAPARIAKGGKAVYGAAVGILMLQARFPRIPGDVGHAQTWPFPVHYKVVAGASPDRVVRHRAAGLLDAFVAAAPRGSAPLGPAAPRAPAVHRRPRRPRSGS